MTWENESFVTMADLYVAYRKSKVDMFYERDHVTAVDFCEYEENLASNLKSLFAHLQAPEPIWQKDLKFVGGYGYVPKSLDAVPSTVDSSDLPKRDDVRFVNSSPDAAWKSVAEQTPHVPKFRIVGCHPVAFHVVSALWLLKVGHLYDGVLQSCAYGSRLRRTRNIEGELCEPSNTSMGSFRPYTFGFREWRANGLAAIRTALENGHPVIAVTADLRRFYHEVSPEYLVNSEYLHHFGIELSADQRSFTVQMIEAIRTWAAATPDHKDEPGRGLPVGLSAPRVIANALLAGFDKFIQQELSPLYYGRYVDDVLLVLDNQRGMKTADEVWKYLIDRSKGLLHAGDDAGEAAYWLELPYSSLSKLRFAGDKQKVFSLVGTSGLSLLESISRTVSQRSSDWRLLPDLPGDTAELTNDFVIAGQDATEEVDNLRKSDGMSIRRLAFALRMRNLEAVQRDLEPSQWKDHRDKFFSLAMDHMLTVPGLFAYGPYLSRLVGLAVACRDWAEAAAIVRRLISLFELLRATTKPEFEKIENCLQLTLKASFEAAIKAIGNGKYVESELVILLAAFNAETWFLTPSAKQCLSLGQRLYAADLARTAFREQWLDGEIEHMPPKKKTWLISLPKDASEVLRIADAQAFLIASKLGTRVGVPRAIAFPTRPLNPAEIVLLDQKCLTDNERFKRWVRALRGTELPLAQSSVGNDSARAQKDAIVVPNRNLPPAPMVAIPCFETKEASWVASVAGTIEPDPARYFRLNKLVNDVLNASPAVQYLVLPELALPRRWFNRLAHKLSHSGVSLIAGLEYLHFGPPSKKTSGPLAGSTAGFVSNQVRASLVTDALGYRTHVIYVQEKERPAPDEEANLRTIAGKILAPKDKPRKPVIRHGGLHFGILICSELTNLEFRQPLRGRIDALFVPEWNKDTTTFASLVEASALDIHCFVVQANNRSYGDCRIRAPYYDSFRRDVARVMGGETDYFVIGKIDVHALRAFQSNFKSPTGGLFKPTPDGFLLDPLRRVRPELT